MRSGVMCGLCKECQIRSGDIGFVVRDKISWCQHNCTVNGGLDKISLFFS